MPANAMPKSIYLNFQWRLRISGLVVAHFQSVVGLESEFEMTDYFQGGSIDPDTQTPGKRKHTPIVLSVGESESNELWLWHQQIGDVEGKGEQDLTKLRKTVFVDRVAKDGKILRTSTVNRAILSKFKAGDYGTTSDNSIEEATLTYRNFDRDK